VEFKPRTRQWRTVTVYQSLYCKMLPVREEANIAWQTVILTTLMGFHTCVTAWFVTGKGTSISYPTNILSRNPTEAIKLLACMRTCFIRIWPSTPNILTDVPRGFPQ
jgi:hypothetical protein